MVERLRLPAAAAQVDVRCVAEGHALAEEKIALLRPAWDEAAAVIHDSVAGIAAEKLRIAADAAHQPGVPLAADQPGNLAVSGDTARRDLLHRGKDFIGERFVHAGITR